MPHTLIVRKQKRSTTHSSAVEVKIVVLPLSLSLLMLASAIGDAISTSSPNYACDGKQPRCLPLPALWTTDKSAFPLQQNGRRTVLFMFTINRHTSPFLPSGDRAALNSSSWKYPLLAFRSYLHPLDDGGLPHTTEVYRDGSIYQGGGSPLETTGEGSAQTRQYSAISATELKGRTFNWEVSSSFSKR